MSISSTANRVVYTGNGVTTAFSFPYEYFASTDLVVLETVIATGAITTKALTTDYIVSGVADASGIYPNGGTVTALTPPASTVKWTIYRDPSPTQTTVFVDNDKLPAASINNGLDKLTIICQRLKEIFLRSARLADGDISGADVTLPTPVASQLLGWDALGTSIVSYASSTIASGLTVTTFAASMLASASASAWRGLLGLGGAALLADPVPVGHGGIGGGITNTRLAKTALYTVLNADKGKTIALGGSACYTLTFGGAAGYDADFSCLVLNEDTGRGKIISLAAVGTFILYPGQSVLIFAQNNAWHSKPAAQRWVLQADTTFFVDKALGSDSNDGLLAGTGGAYATIQKAINVVSRNAAIDCNNFTVTIRVAAGTYSENLNVFGGLIGADVFNIVGDIATPSNVVIQTSTITPCLTARDYGTVDISGFRFASTTSGSTYLSAAQSSTIDMHACDFGNGNGAVHMYADSGGFINVTGNYSISTAAMTFHAFARYGGSIRGGGGRTVTCTQTMAFNTFWIAQYGGFIGANGSAVTFSGSGAGGASTGTKYDVSINGTIELDSTTLPGATAGTTATGGQVTA